MKDKKTDNIIEEVSESYEKDLLAKVREGTDREAFYRLVKLYDGKVFSIAYRILGNRDDAVELAQDVFVKVFKKIRQYRGEVPFKYWIRKIAVNLSLNRLKERKSDVLSGAGEYNESNDIRCSGETPGTLLEASEKNRFLREALLRVSENFRVVLVLKDIEGYKYEEITGLLGLNMGTVKSRLSRGRQELRKALYGSKNEVAEYEM